MISTDEKEREMASCEIQENVLRNFRAGFSLILDTSLTPPLARPSLIDPPLLAHRYLPISIAGDGAFSRTILAQDVLDPKRPVVAIKAMKPEFEGIGHQVCIAQLWS